MITITQGQWFPLNLTNIRYQGADFDALDASGIAVSLVNSNGAGYALTAKATAYNELSCVCDGDVPTGAYYLQITATLNDKSYRMKTPDVLVIISDATSPSTAQKTSVAGDDWELTADVEMAEGEAQSYMSKLEATRKSIVAATVADLNAKLDQITITMDGGNVMLNY